MKNKKEMMKIINEKLRQIFWTKDLEDLNRLGPLYEEELRGHCRDLIEKMETDDPLRWVKLMAFNDKSLSSNNDPNENRLYMDIEECERRILEDLNNKIGGESNLSRDNNPLYPFDAKLEKLKKHLVEKANDKVKNKVLETVYSQKYEALELLSPLKVMNIVKLICKK